MTLQREPSNPTMKGYGSGLMAFDHPSRLGTVLTPFLIRRILAGWKPTAVVAASDGSVSLRTVYRWRASVLSVERVRVGAWEADFAIRRKGAPVRISEWERAA